MTFEFNVYQKMQIHASNISDLARLFSQELLTDEEYQIIERWERVLSMLSDEMQDIYDKV